MAKRFCRSEAGSSFVKLPTTMLELVFSFLSAEDLSRANPTSSVTYWPTWMSSWLLTVPSLMKRTDLSKVLSLYFEFNFTPASLALLNYALARMPELLTLVLCLQRGALFELDNNNMLITNPACKLQTLEIDVRANGHTPDLVAWALKNVLVDPTTVRRLKLHALSLTAEVHQLLSTFTNVKDLYVQLFISEYQPGAPLFEQDLDSVEVRGSWQQVPEAFCYAKSVNLEFGTVSKDFVVPRCVKNLTLGPRSYQRTPEFLGSCLLEKLIVHSQSLRPSEFLKQLERHAPTLRELALPFSWLYCAEKVQFVPVLSNLLSNLTTFHLPHENCDYVVAHLRKPWLLSQFIAGKYFSSLERVLMRPCGSALCFLKDESSQRLVPSGIELIVESQ
jgi:hypothetical protein